MLYYFLLGTADISMAVPICNSLTFLWTWAAEVAVGGEKATGILLGNHFWRVGLPQRGAACGRTCPCGLWSCVATAVL